MKTITVTKTDLKALDAYFDEGPPLEGAIATFWAKVERLNEKQTKLGKMLLQVADLLDDDVEFKERVRKAAAEDRLASFLRTEADFDGACG